VHRVIETHRVQKVPHGRTPYGGEKPVVGYKIGIRKYGWGFSGSRLR
jgi:hypothetical protein